MVLTDPDLNLFRLRFSTSYAFISLKGGTTMPSVGTKRFSYTTKGTQAATKYARRTGKKVVRKPTKPKKSNG